MLDIKLNINKKPSKLLLSGLVGLWLLCAASPAIAYGGMDDPAATVHEYQLDNGLRLLVQEDHRSAAVTSQLWYKVGSSYEPAGLSGISHALEHMMFKGTEKYPEGEFQKLISQKGGQQNAFTGRDYTVYFANIAAQELPLIFQLEADRMRNVVFNSDTFAKEKKVIIEERLWRIEDQPVALAEERFHVTAYPAHGYQQPVIGWMADIEALKVTDLQQWYQTWYTPSNAILVIVGNVVADDVYALAKQYFGKISVTSPAIEAVKPRKAVSTLSARRVEIKSPAQVPYLLVGYNVPSVNTTAEKWEAYALDIIAHLLAGGDSSRFTKYLMRQDNVTAQATVNYVPHDLHATLFTMRGVPAQGKTLTDLEAAFMQQIDKLQTDLVSKQELERIKIQIIADNVYTKDSMFYQAYELGQLEAASYGWREADTYLTQIQKITPKQLQQVAQKYLTKDNSTVAQLIPGENTGTNTGIGTDIDTGTITDTEDIYRS